MKDDLSPSKTRNSLKYRGQECLNCGHALDKSDQYCPSCGQLNSIKKLSLFDYFNEFILSIFVYDSKIRFTITDLLFHPGRVSLNYSQGKRQRYANPFRFFLSVSIIYFLLSGLISFIDPGVNAFNKGNNRLLKYDDPSDSLSVDESQSAPPSLSEIGNLFKKEITKAKQKDTLRKKSYTHIAPEGLDSLGIISGSIKKLELFSDFYGSTDIKNPVEALDSLHYPNTRFNVWLYSRNEVLERISENPLPFIDYLKGKIPFFLFFFTPVFALFFSIIYFKRRIFKRIYFKIKDWVQPVIVQSFSMTKATRPIARPFAKAVSATAALPAWLLFVKRKFNYMDHVIFMFHIFTFVFLVLLLIKIPDYFLDKYFNDSLLATIFLMLVVPFYFYKALHNFYRESRFATIVKCIFLILVFLIIGGLFALIFFGATMVAY